MNKMVKIKVDGKEVTAREDVTILEVAKGLGIEIPTLCSHEAVAPYGACRLCLVELDFGKRSKLTTACTYPVWDGLVVKTNSEKVIKARRFVIELILARCPDSEEIQKIAKDLGVEEARFKTPNPKEKCILCGLCLRVCRVSIGVSAISFINRSIDRVVETPFKIDSKACIGCGACALVCPTNVIKIEDVDCNRKLETWHGERKLAKCKVCDECFAPVRELEYIKEKLKIPEEMIELCALCRRKKTGKELAESEESLLKKS